MLTRECGNVKRTRKQPEDPNRSRRANASTRISREEREKALIDGAINYFADVGFNGQMRALADRIGVSQALVFKHFVNKEALVERVFQEIYLKRWNVAWEYILEDYGIDLKARLVKFYDSYVETCADHQWMRIFMFASLARRDINARYLSLIKDRIIPKICAGVRRHLDIHTKDPYSDVELEMAWGLHGSILYHLIQRSIYENAHNDSRLVVRSRVGAFVDGVSVLLASTAESGGVRAPTPDGLDVIEILMGKSRSQ
jgi:AcrR family transcriptional regulator